MGGMTERSILELEIEITQGAARIDAAPCAWLLDLAEFDRRSGFENWECRSTALPQLAMWHQHAHGS